MNELAMMNLIEIRKYLKKKTPAIILPIGTLEIHGTHLPLASDSLVPEELAKYIAKKIGILTAPTVHYGITKNMMHYLGSISIDRNSFKLYLKDILNNFVKIGFNPIILINGHGDHVDEINQVISKFTQKIILINWYNECKDITKKIFNSKGGHAVVDETAAIMSINSNLVNKNNFKKNQVGYYSELNKNKKWSVSMLSNRADKGFPIFNKTISKKYFSKVKNQMLKIVRKQI